MLDHFDVRLITAYHDEHFSRPSLARRGADEQRLWHAIEADHLCNSLLLEEEDKARRRDVPARDIARCKRLIDGYDQRRDDAIETIDEVLLAALADLGAARADARLSSETPGSMIDRLSILALEIHRMSLQAGRAEAGADHVAHCRGRLVALREQRADLAGCLDRLLRETVQGTAYFKVYRRFGTSDEAAPNPWFYRRGGMAAQPPGPDA